MQVYKAYFKIIKKNFPMLLIYITIFLVITAILSGQIKGLSTQGGYSDIKNKIAFFTEDSSPLALGLKDYLSQNAQIVAVDKDHVQDALFFGQIDCALTVPAGFTDSVLGGSDNVKIEKETAAGSYASVNLEFLAERYLTSAKFYADNLPGISQDQIVTNLRSDLDIKAAVDTQSYEAPTDISNLSYYFQVLAYFVLALLILGVTSCMMTMNHADLNNRHRCSPVTPLAMNLQILLGNLTYALIVFLASIALVVCLYRHFTPGPGVWLLMLNLLAFTIAALSIGFLFGKFVKNRGVQSALTNVISLGISFISGVFVDQFLLGKTVQTISSFTPGYWYIKAVLDIRNMSVYNAANILPVVYCILVQLGFAAAITIIALAISKQRRAGSLS